MEKINNIEIHQAFYGETNKSHGCITSTLEDSELKSFMTAFTDRPSSLSAGTVLEPYLSGTAYGRYYIFTKTFPDTNALRGGMVFTHALVIKLEDLNTVNDLKSLFSNFIVLIPEIKLDLNILSFEPSAYSAKSEEKTFPKYLQQTIEKLITSNTSVAFCGDLETFQTTISTIWLGLPFAFKKKFSYTAGFSVTNLDNSKTIVYFQKSLINSLRNMEFISDEESQEVEIISEAEQYLLFSSANNAFELFLTDLNIHLTDWNILTPCVNAYQLYSKIDKNIHPDELRLIIRNIAKISPNPNDGKKIKSKIIGKLESYVSSGMDYNIKSLRNIPLNEFDQGANILGKAINKFLNSTFKNSIPIKIESIAEIFLLVKNSNNENWWYKVIQKSLDEIGECKDEKVTENIWKLLVFSEEAADNILPFITNKKENETLLIKCIPESIKKDIAEKIALKIQDRKWFLLHAHLLLKHLSCKNAVIKQIEVEEKMHFQTFKGTMYLLDQLTDEDLLSLIFLNESNLLLKEYGRRTISKPKLLLNMDVNSTTWLKIWSASLDNTKDFCHGISNIEDVAINILNLLSNGTSIPSNILNLLGQSAFTDLSDFKNRKEIWINMPVEDKPIFLKSTANGYIEKLILGTLNSNDLEKELAATIIEDQFMSSFLNQKRFDINAVLVVYEQIDELKDSFMAGYINYYSGFIDDVQSSRLGDLILRKELKLSAKQVFEKAKHNNTFKIALNKCKSLINFNFLDTLRYGYLFGEIVSENSVYSALLETSNTAYGQGPEDKDIWKRAGGDISKLSNHKTREENWRHALHLLRNGGGGKSITPKSLLKEMLEDFPNNNQLKEIIKYFIK